MLNDTLFVKFISSYKHLVLVYKPTIILSEVFYVFEIFDLYFL